MKITPTKFSRELYTKILNKVPVFVYNEIDPFSTYLTS